jgi:hypothetical protein
MSVLKVPVPGLPPLILMTAFGSSVEMEMGTEVALVGTFAE